VACIEPDGFLTRCGELLLLAMWDPATPEEVAKNGGVPLFRARSAIREFVAAGLLEKRGEAYALTPKGVQKMEG
jgi:predicted transcriptional regulator